MKLYRVAAFLFTSIATGLAAALIVLLLRPELLSVDETPVPPAGTTAPASYADAVAYAAPAVVNVFATKITRNRPNPLLHDPLFRRFFDERATRPTYRRENSLGSGVIINENGYLLTNNHVIEGASEIQVVLRDGRQFPARVVGTDPETDLAVLQAAGGDLPVATLGDSDRLRVGDVVMAIGNPFGVGQTVTMGIVSATGRDQLGLAPIENFIQTDAAINPGNSGGALI
ncbi:MAG: transcriptional regulator, partial [Gammaproteobacteria bacterium]